MEKEIKEIEVVAAETIEAVEQEVKVEKKKKKKSTKKAKAEIALPKQVSKVVRIISKIPKGFRVLLSSGKIAKLTRAEYKKLK